MVSPLSLTDGSLVAARYRVRASLGAGGMGAVYRVFDEMVGEEVALKILTDATHAAIERFRAEVRLARRITHRNVGRTYDIGIDREVLFITMELVEGETVLAWIKRGTWSDTSVAWLAAAAAGGLAAAHRADVVHRDLKPSNLLVTEDDRVVVIDWGIAAFRDAGEQGVAGTPDYMAPEQLLGNPPAPAQDVYSLGLVMFELLAHERPFSGDTSAKRAQARLRGSPSFSLLPPDCTLTPILRRCLSRDPSARPSAAELEVLLEPFGGAPMEPHAQVAPASAQVPGDAPTRIDPKAPASGDVSHAALMAYVRGLALFRSPERTFSLAFEALNHCVELAPNFLPAVAARGLAAAYVRVYQGSVSWQSRAGALSVAQLLEAVALAEERANHLADTHVARALLLMRDANFAEGVRSLNEALRLDPRHARAHEHLGRVECEAGHAERGVKRILGALTLDPAVKGALSIVGRAHALRGRVDLLEETLSLSAVLGPKTYEEAVLEARFACWWGDLDRAARIVMHVDEANLPDSVPHRVARGIAQATLDHGELWNLRDLFRQDHGLSQRLRLARFQSAAEIEGAVGDPILSLGFLEQADELGLIDIEWLALCPALEVVREDERFERILNSVHDRAQALWTMPSPVLPILG